VVAVAGNSAKNSQASPGGVSRHRIRSHLSAMRSRGCRFVSV